MDKLLKLLSEVRSDVNFEKEEALIDNGILDSFDVVCIVGEVNDRFDVEIRPVDMVPQNFNSAKALYRLIGRLSE